MDRSKRFPIFIKALSHLKREFKSNNHLKSYKLSKRNHHPKNNKKIKLLIKLNSKSKHIKKQKKTKKILLINSSPCIALWIQPKNSSSKILFIITQTNSFIKFMEKYLLETNLISNKFYSFKVKNKPSNKKLDYLNS